MCYHKSPPFRLGVKKLSTSVESCLLSPKEKHDFEAGYKEFVLSELLLAIMAQDEISVRELAKMADVSPTVVQAMRSGVKKDFSMTSFIKVLRGLGFKKLIAERNGQAYPLDITHGYK